MSIFLVLVIENIETAIIEGDIRGILAPVSWNASRAFLHEIKLGSVLNLIVVDLFDFDLFPPNIHERRGSHFSLGLETLADPQFDINAFCLFLRGCVWFIHVNAHIKLLSGVKSYL